MTPPWSAVTWHRFCKRRALCLRKRCQATALQGDVQFVSFIFYFFASFAAAFFNLPLRSMIVAKSPLACFANSTSITFAC